MKSLPRKNKNGKKQYYQVESKACSLYYWSNVKEKWEAESKRNTILPSENLGDPSDPY